MKNFIAALKPYLSKLLIIPPIVAGIVILVIAIRNRTGLEKVPEAELARTLRVITVDQMDFVPRAVGYGTVRPAQVWSAIAEVKGRVVELHPDLESGSFVNKGTVLVRIDDTDTRLAISRLDAEIAKANASIAELNANQKNFEASIDLEQQAQAVADQELSRVENLIQKNAFSSAEVATARQAAIAQRQNVQTIANQLRLLPSQLKSAKANLAAAQADLAEKKRDLERIEIRAPFSCRIGLVKLELNQFLATGERLFDAQSISAMEIEAQVAVKNMRPLFNRDLRQQDMADGRFDLSQTALKRYFDLDVVVRYSAGSEHVERKATFERLREELDPQTRSLGVVVVIKDPFKNLQEGPPPASGMYCEVELRGKTQSNKIVIPRSAIHQECVYLLGDDNRLLRRQVTIGTVQSEFSVIESGLKAGDTLVVSDPTPAIVGMLVDPVTDSDLLNLLRQQSSGDGALR